MTVQTQSNRRLDLVFALKPQSQFWILGTHEGPVPDVPRRAICLCLHFSYVYKVKKFSLILSLLPPINITASQCVHTFSHDNFTGHFLPEQCFIASMLQSVLVMCQYLRNPLSNQQLDG